MLSSVDNIALKETSKLTEAEICFRAIVSDNSVNHLEQILNKVRNGIAKLYEVTRAGKPVGFIAFEIYEGALFVLALHANEQVDAFPNIGDLILEKIARSHNCNAIDFESVRSGLIKTALLNGYHISAVRMRKILK